MLWHLFPQSKKNGSAAVNYSSDKAVKISLSSTQGWRKGGRK